MLFFLPPIIAGIAAALATGGSFSRLAALHFHHGWLILGAFVVQILIFSPLAAALPASLFLDYPLVVPTLHILTNLVLIGAICLNWRVSGMRFVALGLLLNFAAIAANGGYMPVSGEVLERVGRIEDIQELRATGHLSKAVLMNDDSRLPFLADIFAVDVPLMQGRVFSAGDVLISIGAFVLVFNGMRKG